MEFLQFKNLLFEKAKIARFDECEIYFSDGESISISVYEGEVEKYNLAKSFGLSFRGKINNKMGYSYTEILDEVAIDMLINSAKNSATLIENDDETFIYVGDKTYSEVKTYSKELENIDPGKMIDLALDLEKEAKNYCDKVVNINGCKISYSSSNYGIYNTKGLELNNKDNILTSYVVPVVEDESGKNDGVGYVVASSLDEVKPREMAAQGVEEALSKLGGKSIPSGSYKTIIYNEAMVQLLETFASTFSGDAAQKGLSLLKGKEGDMIASPIVTIVDDPLMEGGLASAPFDDEGVATFTKELVYEGKLNTLLHNLKTAHKQGVKSTGNGFKASYASSVNVSESNLYLRKGEKSFEDLMKEINEGVIITDLAGLHSGANTVSGDFSLAAKGFYVENGKKTFPVEQITLAGNYFDLLKNIVAIGNDLKFPMSNVGSPSVLVTGLSIAGK
ncbi:MAG: TldD/PmbA family protein [Terrisporobacter othiniensis]|uniref:TldD/PmbA family protein n=2 Tax=Terrisporobacter TaxID=1505652 RepID=A0AAX2ZIE2_9FIRM|nr:MULTISPECIES: TldD/PmbA family protein [Terrisporobacter]MDU4861167.1 TldD/PmbA family protein [Terrisporobacter othiniensis]MDU6994801.1 TldD/PmbA family protein [Terrisporobacter othiniensis]UEL47854.1 TldD/PmbA family protein [Terrisporobacter hibernicus]